MLAISASGSTVRRNWPSRLAKRRIMMERSVWAECGLFGWPRGGGGRDGGGWRTIESNACAPCKPVRKFRCGREE
jgi:hypothetical protein